GFDCTVQLAAKTWTPTSKPVVGVHIPRCQLTVGGHLMDTNPLLAAIPLTSTVQLTTTDVDVNILLRETGIHFLEEGIAKTMVGRGRRSAQSRRYEQNRKIKKFVKGLKPSLKARLLELDSRTLEEVLGVANKQENKMESYQGEKGAQKEGVPKSFQRQDRKKKKLKEGKQSTVASGNEKPEYIHCGMRHGGNACWRKEGRCGNKDHRLKECPNLKTKFIPQDVSSIAIKEQGLAEDDLGNVTTVWQGFECTVQLAAKTWTPTSRPVVGIHIPGRQLTVGGHPLDANPLLAASPLTSTVQLTTTDVEVNILLRNVFGLTLASAYSSNLASLLSFVMDIYKAVGREVDKDIIAEISLHIPKVPQQKNGEECGIFLTEAWFNREEVDKFDEKVRLFLAGNKDNVTSEADLHDMKEEEMEAEQKPVKTTSSRKRGYTTYDDVYAMEEGCRIYVEGNDIGQPEKLKSLKSAQPPSDDSTPHQVTARNDTYTQVLGPDRLGYVSGVGTGPTPTSMWGNESKEVLRIENKHLMQRMEELETTMAEKFAKMESMIMGS
ncbi:hypothetical protein Taro_013650, partial [Colocasia esculenta]|nr:hypothetical protein [Colocasia esculenta]